MNRALKNKTRGRQRADLPDIPDQGWPLLLARYNDRANYEAGTINTRVVKPLQPDGVLANWQGTGSASHRTCVLQSHRMLCLKYASSNALQPRLPTCMSRIALKGIYVSCRRGWLTSVASAVST